MTISAHDVRNAYAFLLGRPPENDEVIQKHIKASQNIGELRAKILNSSEFSRSSGAPKSFVRIDPPLYVETIVDPATLARIVAKTAAYWSKVGATAPHWSVLTHDAFLPENLSQNLDRFYESGAQDTDLIRALLNRIGREPAEFKCCVEYGCGVGRTTIPLARLFPKVVALDISPPHMALAAQYAASSGLSNIQFLQVTPSDLMPASGYDLWYSRLVLQHNAPPVSLAVLEKVFAGLAPNGVAIVGVLTYRDGYAFKIEDYIARNNLGEDMEMHVTPQRAILELAFRNDCCLLDVQEDPMAANWIFNIFGFQKIPGGHVNSPASRIA
jgi:SAM-dependent methyltransferase